MILNKLQKHKKEPARHKADGSCYLAYFNSSSTALTDNSSPAR
ncbi:MAG: hypothetical protein BWY14_01164 [Parcubacteria group bacterium ADurb.Bin192]|nr:MAG: hypothetical protein BWY14_01164 [Parcubacteria group bacterium ADurb.Bin192]